MLCVVVVCGVGEGGVLRVVCCVLCGGRWAQCNSERLRNHVHPLAPPRPALLMRRRSVFSAGFYGRRFGNPALWAGAGAALEGVHAGGDGVPWPAAGADFFGIFFFFAIFYLFSWEFGVLAAMLSRLATACRRC